MCARAEKALEKERRRIERGAIKTLREDPAFVAAVASHYVRYGCLNGAKSKCQIMHAPDPTDGVDKEMNTAAFAEIWLIPQWEQIGRLVDKGGFVDHVLQAAGLGVRNGNGKRVKTGWYNGKWRPLKPHVGRPYEEVLSV